MSLKDRLQIIDLNPARAHGFNDFIDIVFRHCIIAICNLIYILGVVIEENKCRNSFKKKDLQFRICLSASSRIRMQHQRSPFFA
jgi:hypothetical protein